MSNRNQAVVLVGGRGTRLGNLTQKVPKPMLPINGRPFLEYLIALLRREGFHNVLFCTSHLADIVQGHLGDGAKFGITARYSREPEPLGTGGALKFACEHLESQFLVLNGDTIFDIPMRRLTNLLQQHVTATAAMALRYVNDVSRYGAVIVNDGLVNIFEEKERPGPGWINGGIYYLKRDVLDIMPSGESSLERDLFPRLAKTSHLCASTFDGYFLDIGLPETFARAQLELPVRFKIDLVGMVSQ